MRGNGVRSIGLVSMLVLATTLGCATAKEIMALRSVEFRYAGIADPRVAGIPLRGVRSYSDLRPADLGRLGIAVARGDVPMEITIDIEGRNPETNNVTARLVALDWAYLVDDREAVSGRLSQAYAFPPGEPRVVPLLVAFNLLDVFNGKGQDLIDVALALAGQRSSTHKVALRLSPTMETPLGPMRYPVPITLDLMSPAAR